MDARNRQLLCALAIGRYRLGHGKLPKSLDLLGVDSSLLVDPFNGESLIYKPQGSDYLLYSVGPDLKDNGGVPADEGHEPFIGDIGLRFFSSRISGSYGFTRNYHRVPHMKPPKLPPGATPLDP